MSNATITAEAILGLQKKIEDGTVELSLDLAGDKYADPTSTEQMLEYEYVQVTGATKETAECIVLHFEGFASVGVPVYHKFPVGNLSE